MKKSVVSLALVVLVLAVATATVVAGKPKEVPIYFYTQGEHYRLKKDQVGVLKLNWTACTPALVRVFIRNSRFELQLLKDGSPYLDLTPKDFLQLWGPIERVDIGEDAALCVPVADPAHAMWQVRLEDLDAGDYELHFRAWTISPGTDGFDMDGDGKADWHPADFFSFDTMNYVHVLGN